MAMVRVALATATRTSGKESLAARGSPVVQVQVDHFKFFVDL
jgi:hypothetical protein